ncbi:CYTH domain-containing protein [Parabacteroides sp. BX2]|jgi:adenylate cyclase|uniref:CYTH domain-containing protein n=1 Tax=Parabacteroides segnis TaxID=2763058 RepID=A0ABR7DZK0_9BACT|nr:MULTISPECIES: CYTH domain-containing protein [Parabacteroides]MBC5642945.1 CYTH domain-containing protein [Parabacteroides segnis]MCM0713096.1 CYTH domain-containing protein [Parabacteroides sp. TA-V-105]
MATEIERKFIVKGDFSKEVCNSQRIVQGYICSQPGRTVRIRIRGEKGFLTIKGPSDDKGLSRYEFEQEIPLPDAEQLLTLCEPGVIDKVRHLVRAGKHTWEVDVFHGANEGLVMAEIELASEDEPFEKPDWIGEEVSGDRRYYNSMLTKEPYSQWTKK